MRVQQMSSVKLCLMPLSMFLLGDPPALGDVASGAASASSGQDTLSLVQAQRIALERNWDLLAAAKGIDAALAQRLVSHEFPNPTFSYSTAKISIDDHPSSTPAGNGLWERSYDTILAVNQLFEVGGKRRSRQSSAQAGLEGAQAQFFDARRTLDLAVAKAYVAAAQAEESVRVLGQSAGTLRQEARIAELRLKAGEISSSDKDQIEITADRFELEAKTAESTAAQARVALETLLGTPHPQGAIILTDRLETLAASPAAEPSPAAAVHRPDVVAAEAAVRKSESDLRLQKANRIPDPTVLFMYEHEPPDQPDTVGLGLSFPLPLWNRNTGNLRAAEAARDQARLALQKAEAQAAADIATARLSYDDAQKRWQSYQDAIRPKSENIRKTIAYAYEKGGVSLLDLLVAERNDNEVRLAATQAAADKAVAVATLKAATFEMDRLSTHK
jgi:cobalt-zinc-cadmium efflux system outer membrane protein